MTPCCIALQGLAAWASGGEGSNPAAGQANPDPTRSVPSGSQHPGFTAWRIPRPMLTQETVANGAFGPIGSAQFWRHEVCSLVRTCLDAHRESLHGAFCLHTQCLNRQSLTGVAVLRRCADCANRQMLLICSLARCPWSICMNSMPYKISCYLFTK